MEAKYISGYCYREQHGIGRQELPGRDCRCGSFGDEFLLVRRLVEKRCAPGNRFGVGSAAMVERQPRSFQSLEFVASDDR